MEIKDIKKKFAESNYHDFDILNTELNSFYTRVCKSIKNNYDNLLYSNGEKMLKKLKPEEIFFMNMHDKIILSILNISIYGAISSENYELLYNGIYTYNHVRTLNRLHLRGGFNFTGFFEALIFNENEFIKQNNWKEYVIKRFLDNSGDRMSGKFDMELLKIFEKTVNSEAGVENHFNNLIKLHSRCQWLTQGGYRECNLINYMPVFLIGIYKFIDRDIKIETQNKFFTEFIEYLNKNKTQENKLVYKFTGETAFLNNILDKDYNNFKNEYKNKWRRR
ncbi:MAG: hypothetical protein LBK13_10070 [Spirochaetales bacterium]|jgi:hypothetical protein|nr:hypothetical protein [Spirochaetales bacterium]